MGLGLLLVLTLPLALAAPALAAEGWSYRGRLDVGSRHYLVDRDTGLKDDNLLLDGEFEATWDSGGPYRLRLRPRLAIDPLESSRNRYDPYDAYVEASFPTWSLRAGQMIENWAIVDTFNPIDVLNRRDPERDFYDPKKLGDVMVRFRYFLPEVGPLQQPALTLYLLPLFFATPLPENRDRFRFDVNGDGIGDLDRDAIVTSPDIAYAARLGATLGDADVFLFYYGGPNRIPTFAPTPVGTIRPVYYRVDMAGVGVQWPVGPWLWKLETAYTSTRNPNIPARFQGTVPDSYFQYVVGVDRTFTDLFGKHEVTVTVEYAGEDDPGGGDLRNLRPFKSNLFLGARYQFHDLRRTEIMASATVNVLDNEQLYKLDVRTILYRNLWVLLGGQFINRADPGETVFSLFPNNTNVHLLLRYEF